MRKILLTLVCAVIDAVVCMGVLFLMNADLHVFNQKNWVTAIVLATICSMHFIAGYILSEKRNKN